MIKVSFVIVARNAENYINFLLEDIEAQDYPKEFIEIILIDSLSEDNTKACFEAFKDNSSLNVLVLDNPGKILACGCNVALSVYSGDAIVRVDAHTRIPSNFISKNIEFLSNGKDIVGGILVATIADKPLEAIISASDNSRFGGGTANFKNPGPERYVYGLAHAMYKKLVYDNVGFYDERLVRTEDNEMHYRIKKAGYKFYFSPEIKSMHIARTTFKSFFKQKWGNGKWIGITLGVEPKCFGVRHFIPMFFVLAILFSTLIGIIFNWYPFVILFAVYFVCAFAFAIKEMLNLKGMAKLLSVLLPFIFLTMHLVYGVGTLVGILQMPNYLSKFKSSGGI